MGGAEAGVAMDLHRLGPIDQSFCLPFPRPPDALSSTHY